MKKITALKPFICGAYTADKGETIEVDNASASLLIKTELAENYKPPKKSDDAR